MSLSDKYLFEPSQVVSLIRDIDARSDLSGMKGFSKLPKENVGPSGQKFRTLISELVSRMPPSLSYMEIGIFRGRTMLTSCIDNPHITHIGVDNFSQFDPDGVNLKAITDAIETLDIKNAQIVVSDFISYFEELPARPPRNVGVFFYDAIHDYRDQLVGLMHGANCIAPGGILLIDDTNYGHVRQSTYDFIRANPDYKLLFETFTGMHPGRMSPERAVEVRDAWFNGTQVLIYDPLDRIESIKGIREPVVEAAFAKAVTQTSAECEHLETRFASC